METIARSENRDPSVMTPSLTSMHYVEWSAIFAGATVALAVSFVLATFGAAVGLSAVSPWTSSKATVAAVSFGAVFWIMLVHIWAFGLGGYLSGRMRHRHGGTVGGETEFRDGAHGAIVWAFAVTLGAIVAAYMSSSVSRNTFDTVASNATDPVSVATDTLLRTSNSSAVLEPTPTMRGDVARVLSRINWQRPMVVADRTYLIQLVAARSAIQPAEAEQRVNAALVEMKTAADTVRKTTVVFGFITAATLLLGAAAAWWGATVGGRDRDANVVWPGLGSGIPMSRSTFAKARET